MGKRRVREEEREGKVKLYLSKNSGYSLVILQIKVK